MGLAIFSSDPLSSTAYGTEEILFALIVGGAALTQFAFPIALAIVALVVIVAISYFQTIHAYPSGGGAYVVAKENLGIYPGLVAGSALLIDYVLTVAVSISAGTAAITSAFPDMQIHTIGICLFAVILIMLMNLRGVRESGRIFSVPVFIFVGSMAAMIALSFTKTAVSVEPAAAPIANAAMSAVPIFIILKAFASGCATLTGIEAMANGVRAFKPPEARNAGITLAWMAGILAVLTLGIAYSSHQFGILPNSQETVLSQLARTVFSVGPMYYVIQFSTATILFLAANSSFAGLPRLAAIMADDKYLPRQLSNRGDKLVYSNGIIILAILASLLIALFNGDTHALIPLYAIGVFTAFTLSQSGMIKHWLKERGLRWRTHMLINGVGALVTAVVLMIIIFEKFFGGAWIVLVAIPLIMALIMKIHQHYLTVAEQLSLDPGTPKFVDYTHHTVIVPVSGAQQAVRNAVRYAKVLSDDVIALYISIDPAQTEKIKAKWQKLGTGVELTIIDSPYRSIIEPLIDHIDKVRAQHMGGIVTILLPEFVPSKWWHHLLHNQTALLIKGIMLFKRGVVCTSVPFHLDR